MEAKMDKFFIAGPCVIESEMIVLTIAEKLKRLSEKFNIEIIFKASFDKANRSSIDSYRGVSIDTGIKILAKVKETFNMRLTTDIHLPDQADIVKDTIDIIQIPAFLCRQTDLLIAAAKTKRIVNIKKGQFMAPWDMKYAIEKVNRSGNNNVWLTERGSSFGYNNLVVDFRGMLIMKELGVPVIYDATHSMQLPGGAKSSLGTPQYAPILAKAAASIGVDGLFFETHINPKEALSDASNMISLNEFEKAIPEILEHWYISKEYEAYL
ncbi:MAG TPA: 3-deoxy-8-phosphooctulonate synthase [Desulfurella acetivorans]|uniref:3-deoxy-8-phosphooctulonate synthase n=1 Tax=Desulfurella acetivorans TaxID=33002 RepID=A0A7C6EC49_DESAE|nr:3-deoxy-8-phosphooctulonate synthase [Desulfurella acetivorans]